MIQTSKAAPLSTSAHHALSELDAQYWECADARSLLNAAELFLPDGELVLASLRLTGQVAIEQFFISRAEQQAAIKRFTRHMSSNLHISQVDEEHASMRSMVTVYAATGGLPGQSGVPATIADVEDLCRRGANGHWLFVRRAITPIFLGPGAASFTRN